jgi:probable rRNA maturation factor
VPPRNAAAGLELDLSYAARRPWAPRRVQFTAWVRAALAAAGPRAERPCGGPQAGGSRGAFHAGGRRGGAVGDLEVSVRVVGAARSRSLNARYRGKDRPTNVLSFGGAGAMPDGRFFLGELVICAPIVAREARAQGKSAESHWAHLTVHGMLHLLGFDHERPAEAAKMEAREVQILDQLGFSNPYS